MRKIAEDVLEALEKAGSKIPKDQKNYCLIAFNTYGCYDQIEECIDSLVNARTPEDRESALRKAYIIKGKLSKGVNS